MRTKMQFRLNNKNPITQTIISEPKTLGHQSPNIHGRNTVSWGWAGMGYQTTKQNLANYIGRQSLNIGVCGRD